LRSSYARKVNQGEPVSWKKQNWPPMNGVNPIRETRGKRRRYRLMIVLGAAPVHGYSDSAGRSGDGQCWRAPRSRNSPVGTHLRTMRKSVILPARSFTWARGRLTGGGSVLAQGLVLIFQTPSDQIDSAMPSQNAYWAPSIVLSMEQGSKWREGIVANSP